MVIHHFIENRRLIIYTFDDELTYTKKTYTLKTSYLAVK